MKYEKEIKELLSDIFRESWMNESEWQEFLSDEKIVEHMKQMSKDIDIGIQNGYTIEEQIKISKYILIENNI